jgi:hypothetical protein
MPVLLLLPVLVLVVVLAWALLLPLSLWARYRNGRARRRAVGCALRVNAGLLDLSTLLFLVSAWIAGRWFADALADAALGLAGGMLVGALGIALTRFEPDADGFHYTPNRWVVLGLTTLIAARIVAGLWLSAHGDWVRGSGWLGVGGVLLGYALATAWGLRARLPRTPTAR